MSKSTESERRIQVAVFDKKIAEMRLEQARRAKAQAEFQANWYEHAPLSWLLRKTAYTFDKAVSNRLTRVPRETPIYDTHTAVDFSEGITSKDLHNLSRSYQESVRTVLVGPQGNQAAILSVLWTVYRAVRKGAKLLLKPILSRRGAKT